jgi:hypothetical protein
MHAKAPAMNTRHDAPLAVFINVFEFIFLSPGFIGPDWR